MYRQKNPLCAEKIYDMFIFIIIMTSILLESYMNKTQTKGINKKIDHNIQ